MKEQNQMQACVRETIDEHLRKIGVSTKVHGFRYLKEAIAIVVENPKLLMENTKVIYYSVAEHFGTTYQNVEKNIRYAIERVFDSGENIDAINDYFGNTISQQKGKATSLEFIAAIKEQIIEESGSMKLAAHHLRTIGVPMHLNGYQYLKMAIALTLEHPKRIKLRAQSLYYKLAEVFYKKPLNIKLSIGDAIDETYKQRGDSDVLKQYFESSKPTPFNFIKCVVNRIIKDEDM